ncbi:hypothetical protein [Pseudomonas sp. TWP3-1]|uniref:hypothetical protein n=1 Tax=Pseudomonas sp. TWP3-1 TaxID=2804631 RepID=UPI003CFA6423
MLFGHEEKVRLRWQGRGLEHKAPAQHTDWTSNRRDGRQNADHNGQHQKPTEKNRHLSHEGLLNAECPAHRALRDEVRCGSPKGRRILNLWLRWLQVQIEDEKADQMDF